MTLHEQIDSVYSRIRQTDLRMAGRTLEGQFAVVRSPDRHRFQPRRSADPYCRVALPHVDAALHTWRRAALSWCVRTPRKHSRAAVPSILTDSKTRPPPSPELQPKSASHSVDRSRLH